MLTRILKALIAAPVASCLLLIVVVNAKLIPGSPGQGYDNAELLKELRGLKRALDGGADVAMQRIYPEGYVFVNSIYALAWGNFLLDHSNNKYFSEGHAEIEKAWSRINSPEGKAPFETELSFARGAFYNGWSAYVLGTKLSLESPEARDRKEVQEFKTLCHRISKAIQESTFPASYPGSAWPADAVVCAASLSLHDRIFDRQYAQAIRNWVSRVEAHYDASGMIPHSVRPFDGKTRESARGSSQALMLIFMREIDEQVANKQFKMFRDRFVDAKVGLAGIREYPMGEFGLGDIDSGPVILGFGGVATIVGMQTLSVYGEATTSWKMKASVNALGMAFGNGETKDHFLGLLPIADAFIAWGHSRMNNTAGPTVSFLTFHLYSLLIFLPLSVFFWMLVISNKPDSERALSVSW